jgi:recombination protein RecA
MAPPFREANLQIIYGKGIDQESEMITMAMAAGVIEKKSNGIYQYGDIFLGQQKSQTKEKLEQEKELFKQIKDDVIKFVNS